MAFFVHINEKSGLDIVSIVFQSFFFDKQSASEAPYKLKTLLIILEKLITETGNSPRLFLLLLSLFNSKYYSHISVTPVINI